jgi:hypothetical protein
MISKDDIKGLVSLKFLRPWLQFSRCSYIGQSFAPIVLHKTDAASDWLLIKRHYIGKKGLSGVQLQNLLDYISYQRDFSIYRKEDVLFSTKKNRGALSKNSKTSRGPY